MSDSRLALPAIDAAAEGIVNHVLPVFDDAPDSAMSRLVWLDSRPGLGSHLVLEETLRRIVERQPGWSISLEGSDAWSRVGLIRRGLSQPHPDTRIAVNKPWVCLTLDGLKRSHDDGVTQLVDMLGVLTVAANLWKPVSNEQLSKKDALKQIARDSGEVVANKAVGTLTSMIPMVGGILNLGYDIATNMDKEALRALKPSLRLRRSRQGEEEAPEEELLIGGMVASQLLDVIETFDSATNRVPLVVMIRDAQLIKTEVEAFIAQLLGDERSTARNVAVVVSTATAEPVEWLEQLCTIEFDRASGATDEPDGVPESPRVMTSRFVQGHNRVGSNDEKIRTIGSTDAETIVEWFGPAGAFESGVPTRLVERSSMRGRVSIDVLLEYIEEGAERHTKTGSPLTLAWADQLTSRAARVAADAVSHLFSRRPSDLAADVLVALVHLGGRVNSSIMAEIQRECGDTENRAVDSLVEAGLVVVSRVGVVSVVNQDDTETAVEAELVRQSADERSDLDAKIGRAAANWLASTAVELEAGTVNSSGALSEFKVAIQRGLSVPSTNGKTISPRMRLVLTCPDKDSDKSEEWIQAARASLVSDNAVRDEGWIALAHAVATVNNSTLSQSARVLRDAIVGEALGFLADPVGCSREIRHHRAARALVRSVRRNRSNHLELGERAAVTMLADLVPGMEGLLGDLPEERIQDLFETLVTSPPSGARDALIERCVDAGVDRHEALRAIIRDAAPLGESLAQETALAIANLADGIDDDALDEIGATRPLSSDDVEGGEIAIEEVDSEPQQSATVPAGSDTPAASVVRTAASTVLSRALRGVRDDGKNSRSIRRAIAQTALSSGNTSAIELAYAELLGNADLRADGTLLSRLAEHLSGEHRSTLLEAMQGKSIGAEWAIAMARLCHEADRPPGELMRQLRQHQRNARCVAHLMRFDTSEGKTSLDRRRLRQAAREGESAGLEELYDFRNRDRRVLPLLAILLCEAEDDRAVPLLESLCVKMNGKDGVSPYEVIAVLNLSRWADSTKQKDAVGRAADMALESSNEWTARDREAACRAIIDHDTKSFFTGKQRTKAIGYLNEAVKSVDNAIALVRALRRADTGAPNNRRQSGNRRRVVRAEDTRLEASKRFLVERAVGQSGDVEAAMAVFEHFERDTTDRERREVWQTLERHAAQDPTIALRVRHAAHQPWRIEEAEGWIAFQALIDPHCALHVARATLRGGGTIDPEMAENLVLWAQFDPKIAASVARVFADDSTDSHEGGDLLATSQQKRLRQALVRHSDGSIQCALSLLLDTDPTRAEIEQVYDHALMQVRTLDWAIVMCRSATTPGRAVEAVERLRLAVRRVREDQPLRSISTKVGIKGVPTLEAFVATVYHDFRPTRTREYRDAVDKCLSAAQADATHSERARRMISFAVALNVYSTRHRHARQAGIRGDAEAKKAPGQVGQRCLKIMLTHAGNRKMGAPFISMLLQIRPTGRDRKRIMRTVAKHVEVSRYPSSIAVKALFTAEVEATTSSTPHDRVRGNSEYFDALSKAAKSDPTALAAVSVLRSLREGTKTDLDSLVKFCEGRRTRAAAIAEYVRLAAIEHPDLCDDNDRGRIAIFVRDFLRNWDEPFDASEHMDSVIAHRCVARTEGLAHPALLAIRARALVELGDKEKLVDLLPKLREHADDPVVAFTLGRVATSSFDLEQVREVLFAHSDVDALFAAELVRLGITWRRRRELFGVVESAKYELAEERAALLGMLASDHEEKEIAQAALKDLVEPTARSLEMQVLLSDHARHHLNKIVGMREETQDAATRARLTCTMIPFYGLHGGFAALGQGLLEWLGPDSADPAVGLEILRSVGRVSADSVALRPEERNEIVSNVLNGTFDGSVALDRVLRVLDEEEVGAHLLGLLERHWDERLLVPLVYRFDRPDDPDRLVRALERFWPRSTESVFAALWLLEERDMDDPRFAEAWNQLAHMAMTSPRLLVRLAQFSKRPLAQLSLCRLMLGIQKRARQSEVVRNFAYRSERELLGYERGSASRRRRLLMAATTIHPTHNNRVMAQKELRSSDSTVVELAAVALTDPDEETIDELRGRVRETEDDREILVKALLLGGRVESLPVAMAAAAILPRVGQPEDVQLVRDVLDAIEATRKRSRSQERSRLITERNRIFEALLGQTSIPDELVGLVAAKASDEMLPRVVEYLERQSPVSGSASAEALDVSRRRLARQRKRDNEGAT